MSTQVSTQTEQRQMTLRDVLNTDKAKTQIASALPSHITADRFVRVALTAMTRTPKLLECTQASFMKCILDLSAMGIEPDGRRAHLIPRKNGKLSKQEGRDVYECTLVVDWKGLAELVMRSNMISKLHADLVCENDIFEYNLGEVTRHQIDFKKDRGVPYAAYALAQTKDGAVFAQVMTKFEIEAIRDESQAWIAFKKGWSDSSIWQDFPGEMWKKTVFRRLSKWLPLSPEYRDAIDKDDRHEGYERDVTGTGKAQTAQERLQARLAQNPQQEPENAPTSPETAKAGLPADDLPFTEAQTEVLPPEDQSQEQSEQEEDIMFDDFILALGEMTDAAQLKAAREQASEFDTPDKVEEAKNAILKRAHAMGLKWSKGEFVKA